MKIVPNKSRSGIYCMHFRVNKMTDKIEPFTRAVKSVSNLTKEGGVESKM